MSFSDGNVPMSTQNNTPLHSQVQINALPRPGTSSNITDLVPQNPVQVNDLLRNNILIILPFRIFQTCDSNDWPQASLQTALRRRKGNKQHVFSLLSLFSVHIHTDHKPITTVQHSLTNIKERDVHVPNDRQGVI